MQVAGRRGIVVVGAQKAASTTFAALLSRHPQISALSTEYFGFIERADDAQSLAEVDSLLADLPDRPFYAFKCASYLAAPDLAPRLADHDLDIVVVLRNPVERAVSAWYWYVGCGFAPAVDHEIGLRQLLRSQLDPHEWPHAYEILRWGEYASMLSAWADAFAPERVHVFTEDAVAKLDVSYRSFLEALGLSTDEIVIPTDPANQGIYSLARLRWLRTRLKYRWRPHDDGVWRMSRPTAPFPRAVDAAITGVDRLLLRPMLRDGAPLSDELRRELERHYSEDQSRLASVLERTTSY